MNIQKKFIGLLAAAFCLFACSVDNADDDIYWPTDNTTGEEPVEKDSSHKDTSQYTIQELELDYNYNLLYFYYINASTELGDFEDYQGKGGEGDLADVYYMYNHMRDSYTIYYGPEYVEAISNDIFYSEQQYGIGAEAKLVDSVLIISQVYPKGPAEKAGLQKGDTVVTIDGARPSSVENFNKLTSGRDGSSVTISVNRGEENKEIEISLSSFMTPTVFLDYVDSIPVIRITEYTDTTVSDSGTYGEFVAALRATEGAKATIIDLRNNPGGTTEQCINITSETLSKGDTIIIERSTGPDEAGENQVIETFPWVASEDGIAKGRHFVLLANNGSGSCSETQIAGMTTNLKTPLVGELTYGKGIGQYFFFTYVGVARMTAMEIFDKDMKSYHKYGIVPDFPISDADSALAKAVELAKDPSIKRTAGYGNSDQGHFPSKFKAKEASGKAGFEKGMFRVKRL